MRSWYSKIINMRTMNYLNEAAIHDWYKDRYHVELTNDEMICCSSSQEALSTLLFLAMCDPVILYWFQIHIIQSLVMDLKLQVLK